LEISEESEPEELDEIVESVSQIDIGNNEMDNLDELINNVAMKEKQSQIE